MSEVDRIIAATDKNDTESRVRAVAALTALPMTTRQVAAVLGCNHSTVVRDAQRARQLGWLDPIPPKPRRESTSKSSSSPRRDLALSWLDAIDMLARKGRQLENLRGDDRYRRRLPDLLRTETDLRTVHAVIGEILTDFENARASNDRNDHTEWVRSFG